MKIIAIGGGGVTHGTFPELDEFCLEQVARRRPRIAYIGTASDDDPHKVDRFLNRFEPLCERRTHLPATMTATELSHAMETVDLIYVGGGDPRKMVAAWHGNGWAQVLIDAGNAGVTLAGVSAGAVCWFSAFLFSPGHAPDTALAGLGLVPMGACPHYSTEPDRRDLLHAAVAAQVMPTTIAIDDGAAVVFENGQPTAVFGAAPGAGAYRVALTPAGVTETPVSLM